MRDEHAPPTPRRPPFPRAPRSDASRAEWRVQRATRAAGGACAKRDWGGRGEIAPRASRWARPLSRVRAARLLPHVPRSPRPLPAGSAPPPALAPALSRSLRAARSAELLSVPSPRQRLSSPAAQPRPFSAAS